MSTTPEDSFEGTVPQRPPRKRLAWNMTVYDSMLMISAIAIALGCLLLFLELAQYRFDVSPQLN